MAGSDRVPDPDDSKRAQGWKCANQLQERNGALLRVQTEVCSRPCLTLPTLLEMGMLRQLLIFTLPQWCGYNIIVWLLWMSAPIGTVEQRRCRERDLLYVRTVPIRSVDTLASIEEHAEDDPSAIRRPSRPEGEISTGDLQ